MDKCAQNEARGSPVANELVVSSVVGQYMRFRELPHPIFGTRRRGCDYAVRAFAPGLLSGETQLNGDGPQCALLRQEQYGPGCVCLASWRLVDLVHKRQVRVVIVKGEKPTLSDRCLCIHAIQERLNVLRGDPRDSVNAIARCVEFTLHGKLLEALDDHGVETC